MGADDDFALTRPNAQLGGPYFANPMPGRYPYGDDALAGAEDWAYCIALGDLGVELGDEVFVAAHAVIGRGSESRGRGGPTPPGRPERAPPGTSSTPWSPMPTPPTHHSPPSMTQRGIAPTDPRRFQPN